MGSEEDFPKSGFPLSSKRRDLPVPSEGVEGGRELLVPSVG